MRKTILAAAVATATLATATLATAGAQARGPLIDSGSRPLPNVRIHAPVPRAGTSWQAPMRPPAETMPAETMRAETMAPQERFDAGPRGRMTVNAYPGYRVLQRGSTVPGYWMAPRYGISNYGLYGFDRPMSGTRWVRYYDDALLVDRYGRVRDGRYGLDFDRYGDSWGYDRRGIPVYSNERYSDARDTEDRGYDDYRSNRVSHGDARDLDYDRDYPYDYRYGGDQRGYSGGYGGYTVTETTVTTSPSVVRSTEYVRQGAKPRRAYRGVRRHVRVAPRSR